MSDNGTSRSAPRRGALLCVVKGGGARGLRPTDRYGEPPVGDGVLDVPHETPPINVCRGRRPRRPVSAAVPRCKTPSGRGLSAQPTGGESVSHYISPSVSASRCHLPRRGRQGETDCRVAARREASTLGVLLAMTGNGAMWASPPTKLQGICANRADRVVRPCGVFFSANKGARPGGARSFCA